MGIVAYMIDDNPAKGGLIGVALVGAIGAFIGQIVATLILSGATISSSLQTLPIALMIAFFLLAASSTLKKI